MSDAAVPRTSVLGIDVDEDHLQRWRGWFAPSDQPFRLDAIPASLHHSLRRADPTALPMEVADTFCAYRSVTPDWIMLTEEEFLGLPLAARRELSNSRLPALPTIWWPERLAAHGDRSLITFVERGLVPSEHSAVETSTWERCMPLLPEAQRLAGTFPETSGPNCFGAVMTAAGVENVETQWVPQDAFETWLAQCTEPVRGRGRDDDPGIVFVWRDGSGTAIHSCVTIGDDWVLNKPSQAWFSPYLVWSTRTAIRLARQDGSRLERRRVAP